MAKATKKTIMANYEYMRLCMQNKKEKDVVSRSEEAYKMCSNLYGEENEYAVMMLRMYGDAVIASKMDKKLAKNTNPNTLYNKYQALVSDELEAERKEAFVEEKLEKLENDTDDDFAFESTTKEDDLRKVILSFIKSLITKKPKFFEYSIKIFYINYLNIAKEMNLNTFNHIKSLQDDIINILNYDLEKAYTTIFTFIRKLCIQLRATIVDKTSSSIKSIYNWQFVNSLILWARVIMKYISNPNIYLLFLLKVIFLYLLRCIYYQFYHQIILLKNVSL